MSILSQLTCCHRGPAEASAEAPNADRCGHRTQRALLHAGPESAGARQALHCGDGRIAFGFCGGFEQIYDNLLPTLKRGGVISA